METVAQLAGVEVIVFFFREWSQCDGTYKELIYLWQIRSFNAVTCPETPIRRLPCSSSPRGMLESMALLGMETFYHPFGGWEDGVGALRGRVLK